MTNLQFFTRLTFATLCLAVSTTILVLAYTAVLPEFVDDFLNAPKQSSPEILKIPAANFRARLSGGSIYQGNALLITQLKSGEAIMASDVKLSASDFSFARFSVSGLHPGLKMFIFWRTVERPDGVSYVEVPITGGRLGWFNLSRGRQWQGTVRKIELGIYGELGESPFSLNSLELHPYNVRTLAKTIVSEWLSHNQWTHSSINAHVGVNQSALLHPPLALAATIVIAFFIGIGLLAIAHRTMLCQKSFLGEFDNKSLAGFLFTLASAFMIAVWLKESLIRSMETLNRSTAGLPASARVSRLDAPQYREAAAIKDLIQGRHKTATILIPIAEYTDTHLDLAFNLRYHLMPDLLITHIDTFSEEALAQNLENRGLTIIFSQSSSGRERVLDNLRNVRIDQNKVLRIPNRILMIEP